jgi:inosine/xanthosine triphosphatase
VTSRGWLPEQVRVRVGSRNHAKLEAVRRGLGGFFGRVELEAVEAASGVPEQPIGFEEITSGAASRARACWIEGRCDLSVGIEDGLIPFPVAATRFLNVGCCVLYDGHEQFVGLSAGFEYPPACVSAATGEPRIPVGAAFDAVYRAPPGLADPGPGAGNIGRLTGGVLTRADYGAQAVVCAMVRMLQPALYATRVPQAGDPERSAR